MADQTLRNSRLDPITRLPADAKQNTFLKLDSNAEGGVIYY